MIVDLSMPTCGKHHQKGRRWWCRNCSEAIEMELRYQKSLVASITERLNEEYILREDVMEVVDDVRNGDVAKKMVVGLASFQKACDEIRKQLKEFLNVPVDGPSDQGSE